MTRRTKLVVLGAAVALAAGVIGTGTAYAARGESDQAITGEAYTRASQAALAHTGGGRVTETEVGDEESYYEVEVTLDDGRQVDIQLDKDFTVVGSKTERGDDSAP